MVDQTIALHVIFTELYSGTYRGHNLEFRGRMPRDRFVASWAGPLIGTGLTQEPALTDGGSPCFPILDDRGELSKG